MKPLILALALVACAEPPPKPHYQPMQMAQAQRQKPTPYSCELYYEEQKKCAFGSCDKQTLARLKNECLRDGGRP
jgi:hypothetical protein